MGSPDNTNGSKSFANQTAKTDADPNIDGRAWLQHARGKGEEEISDRPSSSSGQRRGGAVTERAAVEPFELFWGLRDEVLLISAIEDAPPTGNSLKFAVTSQQVDDSFFKKSKSSPVRQSSLTAGSWAVQEEIQAAVGAP
jgi:hypothetical protein